MRSLSLLFSASLFVGKSFGVDPQWTVTVKEDAATCKIHPNPAVAPLKCWVESNDLELKLTVTGANIVYKTRQVFYEAGVALLPGTALSFDLDNSLLAKLGPDAITATDVSFAFNKGANFKPEVCGLSLYIVPLTSAESVATTSYVQTDLADASDSSLTVEANAFDLTPVVTVVDTQLDPTLFGYRFILAAADYTVAGCQAKVSDGFTEAATVVRSPVVTLNLAAAAAAKPEESFDMWAQKAASVAFTNCENQCAAIPVTATQADLDFCVAAGAGHASTCLTTIAKTVKSTTDLHTKLMSTVPSTYMLQFNLGKAGAAATAAINADPARGSPWIVSQISFDDTPQAVAAYKSFKVCRLDELAVPNAATPNPHCANDNLSVVSSVRVPKNSVDPVALVPLVEKYPMGTSTAQIALYVQPGPNPVSAAGRGRSPSVQLVSFGRPVRDATKDGFAVPSTGWAVPVYGVTTTGACEELKDISGKTGIALTAVESALSKLGTTKDCSVTLNTTVKLTEAREGVYVALTHNLADLVDSANLGLVAGVGFQVEVLPNVPLYVSNVNFKAQPIIANPSLHLMEDGAYELGQLPVVVSEMPVARKRTEDLSKSEVRYELEDTRRVMVWPDTPLKFLEFPGRDASGKVAFAPTLKTLTVDEAEVTLKSPVFNPTYTYENSKDQWTPYAYSVVFKGTECQPDQTGLCGPLVNLAQLKKCLAAIVPVTGCEVNVEAYTSQKITYPGTKLSATADVHATGAALILGPVPAQIYGKDFHLTNVKFGAEFNEDPSINNPCNQGLELYHSTPAGKVDHAVKLTGAVTTILTNGEIEFSLATTVAAPNKLLVTMPADLATTNKECAVGKVFPRLVYSLGKVTLQAPASTVPIPQEVKVKVVKPETGAADSCNDIGAQWCNSPLAGVTASSVRKAEVCLSLGRKATCKNPQVVQELTFNNQNPVEVEEGAATIKNQVPALTLDLAQVVWKKSVTLVSIQLDKDVTQCTGTFDLMEAEGASPLKRAALKKVGELVTTAGANKEFKLTSKVDLDLTKSRRFVMVPKAAVTEAAHTCLLASPFKLVVTLQSDAGPYIPLKAAKEVAAVANLWKEDIHLIPGRNCATPQRMGAFEGVFPTMDEVKTFMNFYPECAFSIVRKLSLDGLDSGVKVGTADERESLIRLQVAAARFTAEIPEFNVTSVSLGPGALTAAQADCLKDPIVTTLLTGNDNRTPVGGVQFAGNYLVDAAFRPAVAFGAVVDPATLSNTRGQVNLQFACAGLKDLIVESANLTLEATVPARPMGTAVLAKDAAFTQTITLQPIGTCTGTCNGQTVFSDPVKVNQCIVVEEGCEYFVEVEVRSKSPITRGIGAAPAPVGAYGFNLKNVLKSIPKLIDYEHKLKSITLAGGIQSQTCASYSLAQTEKDNFADLPAGTEVGKAVIQSNIPYVFKPSTTFVPSKPYLAIVPATSCSAPTGNAPTGRDTLVYTMSKSSAPVLPGVPDVVTTLAEKTLNSCKANPCLTKANFSTPQELDTCLLAIQSPTCSVFVQKRITIKTLTATVRAPQKNAKGALVTLPKLEKKLKLSSGEYDLPLTSVFLTAAFPAECGVVGFEQSEDGKTWKDVPLANGAVVQANQEIKVTPIAFAGQIGSKVTDVAACALPQYDFSLTFRTAEVANHPAPVLLKTRAVPDANTKFTLTYSGCKDLSSTTGPLSCSLFKKDKATDVTEAYAKRCSQELRTTGCSILSVDATYTATASAPADVDAAGAAAPLVVLTMPVLPGLPLTVKNAVFTESLVADTVPDCKKGSLQQQVLTVSATSLTSSPTDALVADVPLTAMAVATAKPMPTDGLVALYPVLKGGKTCTWAAAVTGTVTLTSGAAVTWGDVSSWDAKTQWDVTFALKDGGGATKFCNTPTTPGCVTPKLADLDSCRKEFTAASCVVNITSIYTSKVPYGETDPESLFVAKNVIQLGGRLDYVNFVGGASEECKDSFFSMGFLNDTQLAEKIAPMQAPINETLAGEKNVSPGNLRIENIKNSPMIEGPMFVRTNCHYAGGKPSFALVTNVRTEPKVPLVTTVYKFSGKESSSSKCKAVTCAETTSLAAIRLCLDGARQSGCEYSVDATAKSEVPNHVGILRAWFNQTDRVVGSTLVQASALTGAKDWTISGVQIEGQTDPGTKVCSFTVLQVAVPAGANSIEYLRTNNSLDIATLIGTKNTALAKTTPFGIPVPDKQTLKLPAGKDAIVVVTADPTNTCDVAAAIKLQVTLRGTLKLEPAHGALDSVADFATSYTALFAACTPDDSADPCTGTFADLPACLKALRTTTKDCKVTFTQVRTALHPVYVNTATKVAVLAVDAVNVDGLKFAVVAANLRIKTADANCKSKFLLQTAIPDEDATTKADGATTISDEAARTAYDEIQLVTPKEVVQPYSIFTVTNAACASTVAWVPDATPTFPTVTLKADIELTVSPRGDEGKSGVEERGHWSEAFKVKKLEDCSEKATAACMSKTTLAEIRKCLEDNIKSGCKATIERTLTAQHEYKQGATVGSETGVAAFILDKINGVAISALYKKKPWVMTKVAFGKACKSVKQIGFFNDAPFLRSIGDLGPVTIDAEGVLATNVTITANAFAFRADCGKEFVIKPVITLELTADFSVKSVDVPFPEPTMVLTTALQSCVGSYTVINEYEDCVQGITDATGNGDSVVTYTVPGQVAMMVNNVQVPIFAFKDQSYIPVVRRFLRQLASSSTFSTTSVKFSIPDNIHPEAVCRTIAISKVVGFDGAQDKVKIEDTPLWTGTAGATPLPTPVNLELDEFVDRMYAITTTSADPKCQTGWTTDKKLTVEITFRKLVQDITKAPTTTSPKGAQSGLALIPFIVAATAVMLF